MLIFQYLVERQCKCGIIKYLKASRVTVSH
jgi:hypothetical protein